MGKRNRRKNNKRQTEFKDLSSALKNLDVKSPKKKLPLSNNEGPSVEDKPQSKGNSKPTKTTNRSQPNVEKRRPKKVDTRLRAIVHSVNGSRVNLLYKNNKGETAHARFDLNYAPPSLAAQIKEGSVVRCFTNATVEGKPTAYNVSLDETQDFSNLMRTVMENANSLTITKAGGVQLYSKALPFLGSDANTATVVQEAFGSDIFTAQYGSTSLILTTATTDVITDSTNDDDSSATDSDDDDVDAADTDDDVVDTDDVDSTNATVDTTAA